jgi:hypothetical protein
LRSMCSFVADQLGDLPLFSRKVRQGREGKPSGIQLSRPSAASASSCKVVVPTVLFEQEGAEEAETVRPRRRPEVSNHKGTETRRRIAGQVGRCFVPWCLRGEIESLTFPILSWRA